MRRNVIETVMGAAVLLVAVVFVVMAFSATGVSTTNGYRVTATFDNAAGLTNGTPVRMAGVKIGSVVQQRLDPKTYFAKVALQIDSDVELPQDTSARVVPDGLLGSNFVLLEPGGAREMIEPGGAITHTQGAVNIVDMVTRMFFSNQGGGSGDQQQGGGSGGDNPFLSQ
jgi:phospholipid/cholesterol/gamma-HCH transport system substrate-binding protein